MASTKAKMRFLILFIGLSMIGRINSQAMQTNICCLANTVISPCFKWCEEKSCDNLLNPRNCTSPCESNICVCDGDLYRNECNQCVKKEECYTPCKRYTPLICSDPNERLYSCFDPTNAKVCSNISRCSTPRDLFLKYVSSAQPGLCALSICDCKDGYLRNKCNQCVLAKDCNKKCCVSKNDPCSQPNEVRVAKYRKRRPSSRRSKRKCSPFSYKHHRGGQKSKKSSCVCQDGFERDHCSQCLPPDELDRKASCLCSDPCAQQDTVLDNDWMCLNECNARYCYNYWELEVFKNKTCPTECVYGCQCSSVKNLWWNGTICVPAEECQPYHVAVQLKKLGNILTLSNFAQFSNAYLDYLVDYIKAKRLLSNC